ncbi:MAG: hypothetical protein HQK56_00600 [Deltaproteobacteria bacterium]|nr:hypothetical protein [Deltaproteobacteria bacterium]
MEDKGNNGKEKGQKQSTQKQQQKKEVSKTSGIQEKQRSEIMTRSALLLLDCGEVDPGNPSKSISPWENNITLKSPDGKTTAIMQDAFEIGMGAPTSGTLKLSNGMRCDNCNPSIVWSSDSRFLAVPHWIGQGRQRLFIASMLRRQFVEAPGEFRVLKLTSFNRGIIAGIDSPEHEPISVRINVNEITRKFDW